MSAQRLQETPKLTPVSCPGKSTSSLPGLDLTGGAVACAAVDAAALGRQPSRTLRRAAVAFATHAAAHLNGEMDKHCTRQPIAMDLDLIPGPPPCFGRHADLSVLRVSGVTRLSLSTLVPGFAAKPFLVSLLAGSPAEMFGSFPHSIAHLHLEGCRESDFLRKQASASALFLRAALGHSARATLRAPVSRWENLYRPVFMARGLAAGVRLMALLRGWRSSAHPAIWGPGTPVPSPSDVAALLTELVARRDLDSARGLFDSLRDSGWNLCQRIAFLRLTGPRPLAALLDGQPPMVTAAAFEWVGPTAADAVVGRLSPESLRWYLASCGSLERILGDAGLALALAGIDAVTGVEFLRGIAPGRLARILGAHRGLLAPLRDRLARAGELASTLAAHLADRSLEDAMAFVSWLAELPGVCAALSPSSAAALGASLIADPARLGPLPSAVTDAILTGCRNADFAKLIGGLPQIHLSRLVDEATGTLLSRLGSLLERPVAELARFSEPQLAALVRRSPSPTVRIGHLVKVLESRRLALFLAHLEPDEIREALSREEAR